MIADYLRLALGTALVLLPGRLVARTLGQRGAAATLAWGFGVLFGAWAIVFAIHGTIWLAVVALAVVSSLAFAAGPPPAPAGGLPGPDDPPAARTRRFASSHVVARGCVLVAGLGLGLLLWRVAGVVTGDGLFHLARVRKLTDLGDLHLRSVDELAGGGLHPGYAFPLWHGFLALVSALSGLDPATVVNHEASILVPIAFLVAFESGLALFGSALAGISVVAASAALYCLAAGHGGGYVSLALPATSSRQLFVPAAYALFFAFAASGRGADLGALGIVFGALTLIHPTYSLFVLVPLAAYAVVRLPEWRRSLAALAAAAVPTGLAVLWLRPLVDETLSHNPGDAEKQRALGHYAGELVVSSIHHYRLAAEVLGRTGAVAVATLALVPLAGLAVRRRWGALVLGGFVALLALLLVPELFTRFSDAVSLSQSRRAAGFVPFTFAFAGGLALLTRRFFVAPLALVAGIALERRWPGDFAYGLREGGPAAITWFALAGGVVALVLGLLVVRRGPGERFGPGALAAVLFVCPVAWHGFERWSPLHPSDPHALTPSILDTLREVPPRSVVIASPEVSYELLAAAPVYVVAAPIAHVANTRANDPQSRIDAVAEWQRTGDRRIPRRYGATWAVKDGRLYRLSP